MGHIVIDRYIESHYDKWLKQTRRKCYRFGINQGDANDLLQEVFFIVFKRRDETSILEMIATTVHNNYSMLEIFISRTRSHLLMHLKRHQGVVARIMSDMDLTNYNAEQSDEQTGYDVYEKQQLLALRIGRLDVDERTKYILTHKLVWNHNLTSIRGRNETVGRKYQQGLRKLVTLREGNNNL